MRSGSRSNTLLVELLIVVLFFMISATVLMQIFGAARLQGEKSGWIANASVKAQNLAEKLSASEDPKSVLEQMGFVTDENDESLWQLEEEGFLTDVVFEETDLETGIMYRQLVTVYKDEEKLIELPAASYREVAQ